MTQSADNLIWVDLEMTGLNPAADYIIEVATIITDNQLNIVAEGPVVAVKTPEAALASMDEWNVRQHTRSGLLERVRRSDTDIRACELRTLAFVCQHVPAQASPMCGNSICQDRRFMARLMPELEGYFHYRNLDVSSIKILVSRWAPHRPQFSKESSHLALEDIRDSISELRFYRQHYLNV
ncbi:MAG: oligoribonuclease [Gammaproteobacteria bacterium]|nr:oligoribonuclease [Gammaproteobacteria bacterium]